ncbi:phosphatidylserine decarboxylase family protein [Desulforegula conservatrix]|uniref:phosphatidylserine decarboxylase family protein n=1 Tax=Desulforegula conservatrix TaxID=153026 RepID=UPI00041E0F39|nr:phosphatidylserine decarboxylase family protein [Desulforegula conservatrix]
MKKFIWPEQQSHSAFPIARPGYSFIFASAFVTAILAITGLKAFALLSLGITIFICYFFRDPDRVCPEVEGGVISPADGKVVFAGPMESNPYFEGPCQKISVFMSVFNVHVNRIPYDGKVKAIDYFPGKFFNASLDKASTDNERNAVTVELKNGRCYTFVQIAGLIARRIICGIKVGDNVSRGTRYGMICFGSRLDIYLPEDAKINVSNGEKVMAGFTVIANL